MTLKHVMVAATALLLTAGAAAADEWTAVQLRGQVMQWTNAGWQPIARGAVVPDTTAIRTLGNGHAVFVRGDETVDLGPNTQVQIFDKAGTGAKPFTTVKEAFGSVSIEAEVEKVQHFAVETPYLAAVVKGTRFTVVTGKTGASVSVQRGHVAVEDHHDKSHVTIGVGQSAMVDQVQTHDQIAVTGAGKLPPVLSATGKPLPPIGPSPKEPKAVPPDKGPKDGPPGKGPKDGAAGPKGGPAGPGAGDPPGPPSPPPKSPPPPKDPGKP